MVSMSSLSQFRNLSLRVFRIWKGAGHSDSFSPGHALSKDSPPRGAGSLPLTAHTRVTGLTVMLLYNFNEAQLRQ